MRAVNVLLAVLVSVAIGLAVLELGLRFIPGFAPPPVLNRFDPVTGWSKVPGKSIVRRVGSGRRRLCSVRGAFSPTAVLSNLTSSRNRQRLCAARCNFSFSTIWEQRFSFPHDALRSLFCWLRPSRYRLEF